MPSRTRAILLFFCLLVPLLSACAHAPKGAVSSTPVAATQTGEGEHRGPHEGETVTAIVERLELKAHEEWISDGSVIVSNVVAFAIVAPEHFDTLLFAHLQGHPRIGDRPLLLGDAVRFVLPRNWRNRDLSLEELEGLEFAPR
jgi:hypothetical protein